jgi:DNA-binding winged helix-turn-helix (wHTH) protein
LGPTTIHLPPLQRRLLLALVRQQGQVLSRERLIHEVWGHSQVSEVSISRTVHGLRRVFMTGPLGPSVIRTIYGGGYRLETPIHAEESSPALGAAGTGASFPTAHTLSTFVEGLVWVRQRDPRRIAKAEHHLRICLESAPDFTPALVQLASTRLAQYRWGLLAAANLEAEIEGLLQRAEATGHMGTEVLALQVEVLSLLNWQPDLAEARFASWLPPQLPTGAPLHCWVRHLLATGRASEALRLLEPQLSQDTPDGWMLAATAWWFLGEHDNAIGHLREQLRIDSNLVGARLLLALVLADGARPAEAMREMERSGILADADQGLQPFSALLLGLCGNKAQGEALLRSSLAASVADQGMTSLLGLAALCLGKEAIAANLLERAVRQRCGLAPFVRQMPGLRRHGDSQALGRFQAAMTKHFRCPF